MSFNSVEFIIFFPVAVIGYFLLPRKVKNLWLLACSYYFYMAWNPAYILLLIFSTLVTYLSGILIGNYEKKGEEGVKGKKMVAALSIIANIGMLIYFKYTGFFLTSINRAVSVFGGKGFDTSFAMSIVLPVGISFYVFQALSYTIDVYRGDVEPEKNLIDYALFVSFFPQLVAGPIERSKNLIKQIKSISEKRLWTYDGIISGLILMLWGFFMKVVIADRLSVITDPVFDDYASYGAPVLVMAAFAFSIQIYCDFAGYSMIAIGAARVCGIKLMENFNTPYFSKNIGDFWNRWHISLSSWLRDYLYFPLGGSRCSRKRTYFNLMVTFLVSGLWHGAAAKYVVWGGIHGLLQIIHRAFFGSKSKGKGYLIVPVRFVFNFVLISVTWVFFRANSLRQAVGFLIKTLHVSDFAGFISQKGYEAVISDRDLVITLIAIFILFFISLIRYRSGKTVDEYIISRAYPVRITVMTLLIFFILIFGQYGEDVFTQPFVYFQF